MTTLEAALARYPPLAPSRCSTRKICYSTCPPCPNVCPPATGTSAVHFQVTYTCNGATYSPCYYPRPISCPPPEKPQEEEPPCYVQWFDACGRPCQMKMSCHDEKPPCCHCNPPPFCCPTYDCPPPQQCPPRKCCCPPPCPPFVCRQRPEPPPKPPSLYVVNFLPCPGPEPPKCPPPPKIQPPPSCVRYCIRATCGEGSTYSPCYFSDTPKCPCANCC